MIEDLTTLSADEAADLVETLVLTAEPRAMGFHAIECSLKRLAPAMPPRLDSAIAVMERRKQAIGSHYPFEIQGAAVRRMPSWLKGPYACLLPLSPNGLFRWGMSEADIVRAAKVFECIVVVALKLLLGGRAEAVRFAWPSDNGRPPEFPEAILWLAQKMQLRVGSGYRPPRRRDGGVDVVAWRNFGDNRSAFPIILTQCTIQRDATIKSCEIDVRQWSQWLMMLRDPTTAFAVPFVFGRASEEWNELAQRHVVLDRLRLAHLLGERGDDAIGDLEEVASFIGQQFDAVTQSIASA
jgi:hypothetical protein